MMMTMTELSPLVLLYRLSGHVYHLGGIAKKPIFIIEILFCLYEAPFTSLRGFFEFFSCISLLLNVKWS